jgi:peptidyl-prolyl cis-trans isomerase D
MLQRIGDALKGKRTLSWLILVPLALVFAMWGATGAVSLDLFGIQTYAAKVEGERIELNDANRRWQEQQSEWAQQVGTDIPEDLRASLQDTVLERLIRTQLLTSRATEEGYRVSTARVQDAIRNEPAFQVDGVYSDTLALARLAQVGLTADAYRADLARQLQNDELQRSVFLGEFLTANEIGRRIALEDEQREVRFTIFDPKDYRAKISVTDAELADWYAVNGRRFESPERVTLQYAEGSLTAVESEVVVADSDIETRYAENQDRYIEPERRRARHILVEDESAAQEILESLEAGADFATLARERSTDTGSAESGGDLGFAERDTFVGPFAEAVFSMQPGELKGPVQTEFGFHVIRLEAIEGGKSRSLEDVRAELTEELKRDLAANLFGDRVEQAQRRLEQPGADLDTIANDLKLNVGEIKDFTRGVGAAPFLAVPELETAVFGDAVLNQRRIGGPIAIGDDRFVIVRVLDHQKPRVPELAEVRVQAREALLTERASTAAREAAEAAATQGVSSLAKAAPARFADRRDASISASLREAIFALPRPQADTPVIRAIPLPEGGAAVVAVTATRTVPAEGDATLRRLRAQQVLSGQAQGVLAAYVEDMRNRADVTKNPNTFQ